jgi:hypothetical protein
MWSVKSSQVKSSQESQPQAELLCENRRHCAYHWHCFERGACQTRSQSGSFQNMITNATDSNDITSSAPSASVNQVLVGRQENTTYWHSSIDSSIRPIIKYNLVMVKVVRCWSGSSGEYCGAKTFNVWPTLRTPENTRANATNSSSLPLSSWSTVVVAVALLPGSVASAATGAWLAVLSVVRALGIEMRGPPSHTNCGRALETMSTLGTAMTLDTNTTTGSVGLELQVRRADDLRTRTSRMSVTDFLSVHRAMEWNAMEWNTYNAACSFASAESGAAGTCRHKPGMREVCAVIGSGSCSTAVRIGLAGLGLRRTRTDG